MKTYSTLFVIALAASLFITPLVRRACQKFGWLDVPSDGRRLHARPIPRLGGAAVFLSFVLTLAALAFVDNSITSALKEQPQDFAAVIASSTLIFLYGVYDDLRSPGAKWKFVAQLAAGSVLYAMGGRIDAVSFPFLGQIDLPPVLGFVLMQLWVIGICNAFNLIDGLDGLAAGASLFASLVMLGVSLLTGRPLVTVMALALSGALIGFLRYNFNPASIFLGDSGSLFIGFLLAALSVTGSQKASTAVAVAIPLMAFALPVIDTGFAIIRRFISGKPLFAGDKEHIHHKLLELGWSQRRVAFVLYGICALFGLTAMLFISDGGIGRLTGLVLLIVGAAVILVAGRLRYHEVDEVRDGLRRNLIQRRVRAANHIHVRKASRRLSKSNTLSELLAAVQDFMEFDEFGYIIVQLGRGGDYEWGERVLAMEKGDRRLEDVVLREGFICWEWGRRGVEGKDVLGSHLYWTLRLPLSTEAAGWGYINLYRECGGDDLLIDVNYLSKLFQKEMALATERVFLRASNGGSGEKAFGNAVGVTGKTLPTA